MTNEEALFLLVLPVFTGLVWLLVRRNDRLHQFVQQRVTALTTGEADNEPALQLALRRGRRGPSPNVAAQFYREFKVRLHAAFEAAGNRIGILHLIAVALAAPVVVVPFFTFILVLNPAYVTLVGIVAALAAPVVLLYLAQSRYKHRFLNEFPDALDLIRRAVKAGLPVNEALAVAAREMAEPVGSELRRTLDQVQIGVQMIDALEQTADRIRVADFRFLVVALALQAKTGGSLAETLANLSGVIRARKALRQKAHALSAEAKASALVLAILPFVVGAAMYLINRDFARTLFVDPRGRFMLGVAFLSLVTGLVTMAVMVKRALR